MYVNFEKQKLTSEEDGLLKLFNQFFDSIVNKNYNFTEEQFQTLKVNLKDYQITDFIFTNELNIVELNKSSFLFKKEKITFLKLATDDFHTVSPFHKILPKEEKFGINVADTFL